MIEQDEKPRNLYKEFQIISTDYLILLGEKARQAERNKSVGEEFGTMEMFWDGVDNVFKEYERQLHITRLRAATDHMVVGMLEKELRLVYNEMFKLSNKYKDATILDAVFKKSNIPTKKEMEDFLAKDIVLKTPDETYEQQMKAIQENKGQQQ